MQAPDTNYARTEDGVDIAYQVVSEGPIDLLMMPGLCQCIDPMWEYAPARRFLDRLASFTRLVLYDPRGWGASGSGEIVPVLEGWVEDVVAVMDAVASERAALFGFSVGGLLPIMFAAARPERASSLVLVDTFAKMVRDDDYPYGIPVGVAGRMVDDLAAQWGLGNSARTCPSMTDDDGFRRWIARCERAACSRNRVVQVLRDWLARDVRQILPAVRVPSLVLHRRDDPYIRVGNGRYLAENIAGARFVELEGQDHMYVVGDQDAVLDEIEEFLTGTRPQPEHDRVLAAILFVDIVGSTEKAAELGDRRWKQLLERLDALVRAEVEGYRGRFVKDTGDGLVATFDGPARAVRCAQAISRAVQALGIEVRAGVHTGEVELRGEDIGGIAVHIGQRVSALAGPGEVIVSRTVTDLVAGSGLEFEDRGEHELKGVPGKWAIYGVRP